MDIIESLGHVKGSTVAFAALVVLSAVVFAVVYNAASTALVGLIPFYIFLVAAIVAVLLAIAMEVKWGWITDPKVQGGAQQLIVVILLSAGLIVTLSVIFCWTCVTPRPREMFADLSASGIAALQADVAAAEVDVCKYITRADQFIKSDVGPAGTTDPSLVTAAEAKAREGVNMVLCSDGVPAASGLDPSADELAIRTDLENRIARLESTVAGLTGVVFKRAYDETVPCKEGFVAASVPSVADLQERVNAVRAVVADQKTKYLDPIDQKTADLQAGRASDCDKRRGAKLSAAGGPDRAEKV